MFMLIDFSYVDRSWLFVLPELELPEGVEKIYIAPGRNFLCLAEQVARPLGPVHVNIYGVHYQILNTLRLW